MNYRTIILFAGVLSFVGCARSVAHIDVPMVLVHGGAFTMGAKGEKDAPPHAVALSSFYIAKYDITVSQWDRYLKAEHISANSPEGETYTYGGQVPQVSPFSTSPIQGETWYQAVAFCNWLSKANGLHPAYGISDVRRVQDYNTNFVTGKREYFNSYHTEETVTWDRSANGYRLPTEAEWEFAARGGVESHGYVYAGSNDFNEVGWDKWNSGGYAHPVGEKKPNELGLYDMIGNVGQWCWDWYSPDYYLHSPADNPTGPEKPVAVDTPDGPFSLKIARGTDWNYIPVSVTGRGRSAPYSHDMNGIRVARNTK